MYLVEGTERAALIDTGSGIGSLKALAETLTGKVRKDSVKFIPEEIASIFFVLYKVRIVLYNINGK